MKHRPIERSDVDAWFHVFQASDALQMRLYCPSIV